MLYQLLPLLDGWKDISKKSITSITIRARSSYKLAEIRNPGWITGLFLRYSGSPDAELAIELYDPFEGYRKISTTASELLDLGFDMPNPSSMYLAHYDLDTDDYCIAFTPASPLPFYATKTRESKITLTAPKDSSIVFRQYNQAAIAIIDINRFISSVQKVLALKLPKVEKVEITREIVGLEDLTTELQKLRAIVEEIAKRPVPESPIEEIRKLLPGVSR